MSEILGMLAGGLGQAAQGAGRIRREQRQQGYTKNLMGLQNRHQQMLNQQGHELQMDMWNKTNYGAQMAHLKSAGLNPALMYGMSGGGGTTAGSQSGGSAASGQAPNVNETQGIGGAAMMGMQQMAQIKLLEAQTTKANAEAKKIGGIDTGVAEANENAIYHKGVRDLEEIHKLRIENRISARVEKERGDQIKSEAATAALNRILTEKNIKLTEERTREIKNKIVQEWSKVGIKGLDTVINALIGKGGIGALKNLKDVIKKEN